MPSSSEYQHASTGHAGRPRTTALGAYLEGWRRALAARQLVAALFVVTLVVATPMSALVSETLADRFGSSTEAEQALVGWNGDWSPGMTDVAGGTFTLEILGFGGMLRAVSALVNGERLPAALLGQTPWVIRVGSIGSVGAGGTRPARCTRAAKSGPGSS